MKYLHLLKNEKFVAAFIVFIRQNFPKDEHHFVILGGIKPKKHPIDSGEDITYLHARYASWWYYPLLWRKITPLFKEAEKVILHSLLVRGIVDYLYFHPSLRKKSYWVIWGGDLYDYHENTKKLKRKWRFHKKRTIIKDFAGLITYLEGDYENAKKYYGATGSYLPCFVYPSNLYKALDLPPKTQTSLTIQVGNSANKSNGHLEIFEKLARYKEHNIKIIVPLSYAGKRSYIAKIIKKGRTLFGDKFVPLTDFMDFDAYMQLLAQIDIAVFNHQRQQGMGNIITLLGLGKKVYIRSDVTTWQLLETLHVKAFNSCDSISLDPISDDERQSNIDAIATYFSKATLLSQWQQIFKQEL